MAEAKDDERGKESPNRAQTEKGVERPGSLSPCHLEEDPEEVERSCRHGRQNSEAAHLGGLGALSSQSRTLQPARSPHTALAQHQQHARCRSEERRRDQKRRIGNARALLSALLVRKRRSSQRIVLNVDLFISCAYWTMWSNLFLHPIKQAQQVL